MGVTCCETDDSEPGESKRRKWGKGKERLDRKIAEENTFLKIEHFMYETGYVNITAVPNIVVSVEMNKEQSHRLSH